jgi:hypothetical protein
LWPSQLKAKIDVTFQKIGDHSNVGSNKAILRKPRFYEKNYLYRHNFVACSNIFLYLPRAL